MIKVKQNIERLRLVDFIVDKFIETPTRSSAKRYVDRGYVKVNGVIETTAYFPKPEDEIEVEVEVYQPKPYNLKVKVFFEDEDLAVVWKPAGLVTSGNVFKTLEATFQDSIQFSQKSDALSWPRACHRLDLPTSGLTIVAKTITAIRAIKSAFAEGEIAKEYHAVVCGPLTSSQVVESPVFEKDSKSEIIPLRVVDSLMGERFTLVKLIPFTGRKHQLRIHCASIGYPILGDRTYSQTDKNYTRKGLFLSSTSLSFKHPITGEQISIEAEIPTKFQSFLDKEERRFKKFN